MFAHLENLPLPSCTRFQPLCLLSEIPLWAKRAWVETLKLRINAGRSSEKVWEELKDLLCVQTTALASCVGGGLHAKRTTIAEVVVVEEIVARSSDRDRKLDWTVSSADERAVDHHHHES